MDTNLNKKLIDKYLNAGIDKSIAEREIEFISSILFNAKDIDSIQIEKIVEERITSDKPVQLVVGKSYFMGDKFIVSEDTLIPRGVTKIVVEECVRLANKKSNPRILDIGSGTGCIAIEVAKHVSNSSLVSIDISKKAIEVAQKNANNLGVQDRISFIVSDMYEKVEGEFDIIVSNPPYIPISEIDKVSYRVKNFEPSIALFANDEFGMQFYKKIIEGAKNHLKKEGYIVFEHGSNHPEKVQEILEKNNFKDILVTKDWFDLPRAISAKLNN